MFYEKELESEKLIDIKEVDELILAIEEIEKVVLEGNKHTSFEETMLRQLLEYYCFFLGNDGRHEHHLFGKDKRPT